MGKRKAKPRRTTAKRATRKRPAGPRAATRRARTKPAGKKRAAASASKRARARKPAPAGRRDRADSEERGRTVALLREVTDHHETGPAASAGDVDADWQRAQSSGEEAAGGSVSTPDQDRVDDIGHALGVEQPAEAPLRTSEEILEERDRRYWDLERRAGRKADQRREP
jgi:hypothetical protein